ncbi:MAG TPA: hypothetical protein VOA00_03440, partial [Thermoanaerobaculia bacterium]|nr:hypothetical protein [Thermoanaerobaculia bacterium]
MKKWTQTLDISSPAGRVGFPGFAELDRERPVGASPIVFSDRIKTPRASNAELRHLRPFDAVPEEATIQSCHSAVIPSDTSSPGRVSNEVVVGGGDLRGCQF